MSEGRASRPTPDSDFAAEATLPRRDPLVVFVTEYARFSVEEHERLMLRIYGPDRLPGTESRRMSQEGLSCSREHCERVPYRGGLCRKHARKAAEAE